MKNHIHKFKPGRGSVDVCACGKFQHNAKAGPPIVEQRFTPGPWRIESPKAARFPEYRILNGLDRYVAAVSIMAHNPASADAQLISAAPDMLAALEALFEHCAMVHNVWGEGCNQKQADAAIKAGRAVINKAKGAQ